MRMRGGGRQRTKRIGKAGKRWLLLGHRWIGILTGLFFAAWIGSGLVMLYVPFPSLSEAERLAGLPPIAWESVALGPDAALAASEGGTPPSLALAMRGAVPVYRLVTAQGERLTLSARTGARLGPVSDEEARLIAGAGPEAPVEAVARDQWTVHARYDALRPFLKVALGDAAGTDRYVSERTGEIALDTNRQERVWNWLGAIPHWFYPTPLRARAELWRQAILWVSGLGIAGALSGLVLGIWRLRVRRPYPHGSVTPYRGIGRWHHLVGLVGGASLLSFIVSGWLSMNPNHWFTMPGPPGDLLAAYAGPAGPIGLDPAGLRAAAPEGAVELRFLRLGGRWLTEARTAAARRVQGAEGGPAPDEAAIAAAAARAFPAAPLAGIVRLTSYDSYWYPHHDTRPLPVLRLRFADAAATWLHVDPVSGEILNRLDRSSRLYRWLFAGLHRLDLAVLTGHRPAWDIAQWSLNGLGGVIAVTGVVLGWRRLRRRPRSAPNYSENFTDRRNDSLRTGPA